MQGWCFSSPTRNTLLGGVEERDVPTCLWVPPEMLPSSTPQLWDLLGNPTCTVLVRPGLHGTPAYSSTQKKCWLLLFSFQKHRFVQLQGSKEGPRVFWHQNLGKSVTWCFRKVAEGASCLPLCAEQSVPSRAQLRDQVLCTIQMLCSAEMWNQRWYAAWPFCSSVGHGSQRDDLILLPAHFLPVPGLIKQVLNSQAAVRVYNRQSKANKGNGIYTALILFWD